MKIIIVACIGMGVGSKLLFAITQIYRLFGNFTIKNLLYLVINSGFVFYGGLIGAILFVTLYSKKSKFNLRKIYNFAIPAIPLFHVFGRLGCLFAGCCYGKVAAWGVHIHTDEYLHIPVQLYESIFNLFLFVFLLIREKEKQKEVNLLSEYLICYSVFRFIIEFFRGDVIRGILLIFSTSQWISIIIFIIVISKFLFIRLKHKEVVFNGS